MKRSHIALAAAAALSLAGAAHAAQITTGDFTSPVITGFGNPNATALVPDGLVISNYTFNSADATGLQWWQAGNGFNDCVGGCVTDTDGVGLQVDLGGSFALAGLFVGQATAFSLNVDFFDASHTLLGSVVAAGPGDGVAFAGWEDDINKVAFINVNLPVADGFKVAAQSGYLQANGGVPEPDAWALMITGFGLAGATLRRRAASSPA